jgi:hypothetical protein
VTSFCLLFLWQHDSSLSQVGLMLEIEKRNIVQSENCMIGCGYSLLSAVKMFNTLM